MEKINYKSRVEVGDLNSFQSTVEYEITNRTKIDMGSYRQSGPSYGIVSSVNPVGVTNQTEPLAVTASAIELKINVNSGSIVTQTGQIAVSETTTDLDLADSNEGVVNLVIAEYKLKDTDPRPSIYDEVIIPAKQVRDKVISVVTLSEYNNLTIFSSTRKLNTIVLAAAQVYKDENGDLKLNIDTSRSIYNFIRPWFSPVDIEHRNQVGSGTVTENNPHGYTFSDMTSNSLSIYQQLVSRGVVVSKDSAYPNVTGCLFEEELFPVVDKVGAFLGIDFVPSQVESSVFVNLNHNFSVGDRVRFESTSLLPSPLQPNTDYYVSSITKDSFSVSVLPNSSTVTILNGGVGIHRVFSPDASYLQLKHFPLQIGCIFETSTPQNKVCGKIKSGRNIVALSKFERATSLTIRYFYAKAGEPPTSVFNNALTFSQPAERKELLFTGGREFSKIDNPTVTFENSGPIPVKFRVFLEKNGELIKNPSIVLSAIKLEQLDSIYTFNTSLYGSAKIIIGLTQAVAGANVVLRLIGKDIDGNLLNELITFDNTWTDSIIPAKRVNSEQFRNALNVYSILESIEVVSRTNDGPSSSIIVYADYSDALYEALPLSDVFWDGLSVRGYNDSRNCVYNLQEKPSLLFEESPLHTYGILNKLDPSSYPITTIPRLVMNEDFSQPTHLDTTCKDSPAQLPKATLEINSTLLTNGDRVELANGKELMFLDSYSLGPDYGEVLFVHGDDTTTRINLAATINNQVFDSGVEAVNNNTENRVELKGKISTALNFAIKKSEAVPNAIKVEGFIDGVLPEKYVQRDRFKDILDSDLPIPSFNAVRNKYRTTPIYFNETNVKSLLIVGYRVDMFYSIVALPTYQNTSPSYPGGNRPSVYQEPVYATKTSLPNVWVLNFPEPVAKVYFEIFGKMRGITIYSL